ncbi:protein of unknown function [Cupriavidus taiwanensis]|nr:protein of unknown function [Cupriavidus taiwanensis]
MRWACRTCTWLLDRRQPQDGVQGALPAAAGADRQPLACVRDVAAEAPEAAAPVPPATRP